MSKVYYIITNDKGETIVTTDRFADVMNYTRLYINAQFKSVIGTGDKRLDDIKKDFAFVSKELGNEIFAKVRSCDDKIKPVGEDASLGKITTPCGYITVDVRKTGDWQ